MDESGWQQSQREGKPSEVPPARPSPSSPVYWFWGDATLKPSAQGRWEKSIEAGGWSTSSLREGILEYKWESRMKAGKVEPTLKSFKDGKIATPPPNPPRKGLNLLPQPAAPPHHSTGRGRVKWGGGRRVGRRGGRGASNVGGRGRWTQSGFWC